MLLFYLAKIKKILFHVVRDCETISGTSFLLFKPTKLYTGHVFYTLLYLLFIITCHSKMSS